MNKDLKGYVGGQSVVHIQSGSLRDRAVLEVFVQHQLSLLLVHGSDPTADTIGKLGNRVGIAKAYCQLPFLLNRSFLSRQHKTCSRPAARKGFGRPTYQDQKGQ